MPETHSPASSERSLEFVASRNFLDWLAAAKAGIAFTSHRVGKLFLLGLNAEGSLSVFERSFPRPMGVWSDGQTLLLATTYQIWRLENCLGADDDYRGHDRLFVPRLAHTTGDLDVHDLAPDADGRVVFANTLFSCLSAVSKRYSFLPLWKPRFVSRLAAEDRCHLNGFAMRDGRPDVVTVVGQCDVADGWRDQRVSGGAVIDVPSGEVMAGGLSMPHSPRWYRQRLWLHESGQGQFGHLDPATGRFEPVTFCPGYLRGLAFHGDFAVAGLSLARERRTFGGLPLEAALAKRGAEPRCGLAIIDLRTGDMAHWVRIEGGLVDEVYDVALLGGARRPAAIGLLNEEIATVISQGPWSQSDAGGINSL